MQSVGALEAEIYEILNFGQHHHLGSGFYVKEDIDFLSGISQNIENNSTLDKFSVVLHLLGRKPIKDTVYFQNAKLVTQVRNELVHYKSKWNSHVDEKTLFKKLRELNFAPPTFLPPNSTFFPHQFLNSSSASWAVDSVNKFICQFFVLLGVTSPLKPYQNRIIVPQIKIN